MSKHSDEEQFVPASMVPRTASYRNSRGERVGVPPSRIPEDDDAVFEQRLLAGLDRRDLGGMSGFGNFLLQEGAMPPRVAADDEEEDFLAQQDFVEDDGYNAGEVMDDPYAYDKRASKGRVPDEVVEAQIQTLQSLASEAVYEAQEAEAAGNVEAARLLDAKAASFLKRIEAMRTKKALRGGR